MKSILILYIFVLSSWHSQNKPLAFEKRIKIIHSKVIDLTDIYVLHHEKEFNEIYFSPLKFKDTVLDYLQKSEDFQDKLIAVCSMAKLPLTQYVDFINSCFVIYKKGAINEDLFERCVFNEFDTKNTITKEYKNPKVQHLLKEIQKSRHLSNQFKASLSETLSGKSYKNLKKAGFLN